MNQTVMVVAPHPDDESIGCGGTICLHREHGDRLHIVFLTSGERGIDGVSGETARSIRESEAKKAGEVLKVKRIDFLRLPDLGLSEDIELGAQRLWGILEAQPPDVIYLPHPDESHPDHQAALPIVRAALARFSDRSKLPELRLYEVWSPMTRYDWCEDISLFIRQKLAAVRCYESQIRSFRYDRAIRGLNQYRGYMAAGSHYAEVFRWVDPNPSEGTRYQAMAGEGMTHEKMRYFQRG